MSSVTQISKNYLPDNEDQALFYLSHLKADQSALQERHAQLIDETRPSCTCSCWTWLFSSCSKYEVTIRTVFLETAEFYKELAHRLAELYGKNDAAPLYADYPNDDPHTSIVVNEVEKVASQIEDNTLIRKSLAETFSDVETNNILKPLKRITSFIEELGDDFNSLSTLTKLEYLYKVLECDSEKELQKIWSAIQEKLEATDISDRSFRTPRQQALSRVLTMGPANISMSSSQVYMGQEASSVQSVNHLTLKVENTKKNPQDRIVQLTNQFVVNSEGPVKISISSFTGISLTSTVV